MNPIDISGVTVELFKLGFAGLVIAVLLWERRNMQIEHRAALKEAYEKLGVCQTSHMADIKAFGKDMTAALTTASELTRSNNEIQNRAAGVTAQLAEAVREVSSSLEHLEKAIEQRGYRQ